LREGNNHQIIARVFEARKRPKIEEGEGIPSEEVS